MDDDPGDSDERRLLEMFPKFIFVAIIIVIIVFFAFYLTINQIETGKTEMNIFLSRLLYSANGIAYYDQDIDRMYLGIIDPAKIDTQHLEQSIDYEPDYYFAANITLQGVKTATYHEPLYNQLKPLADANIKGPGGADRLEREYRVSYYENGLLKSGRLRIDILRARS